jgi:threonine/homoserine/homoserine lactone efflux protein
MQADTIAGVFVFAFVVSIGAVISPGPVTAAVVSEAPHQGWRVGPLVTVGHSILELAVVILLGLGLSAGMGTPVVTRVIGTLGGLVLLAMGGSYVLSVVRGTLRLPESAANAPRWSPMRLAALGVVMTASNPFWYAWWMTVAAAYLAQARALGEAAVTAFFTGHISADFVWNTALASATGAGKHWLTAGRYRALILVVGGFMAYLGVVFLREAWSAAG